MKTLTRRSFVKRSAVALGLAFAFPLMASIGKEKYIPTGLEEVKYGICVYEGQMAHRSEDGRVHAIGFKGDSGPWIVNQKEFDEAKQRRDELKERNPVDWPSVERMVFRYGGKKMDYRKWIKGEGAQCPRQTGT